ncbi:DAZ-associated protein 2 [Toxorhynchites rutilus septentrionalis]|uniref:DAZ-associated protein 2 n=1 Tax=Toxorhynchites rutilus septentrionalis TaxID=329112 RepID=UPI002478597D|nr:DAZ-associated protein 2 [Toxorhynchites rutilus septentrionalis]
MNNKANNGYPYDAAQSAAYQQYVNSQIPAHAQIPPSYNSVVTSMTPAGYPPYPPGMVQQPFYTNSWSMNPSAPQAAPMQFAHSHLPPPPPYAAATQSMSGIPSQTVHPTMYQYSIATQPQAQPQQVYQTPIYPIQGAIYDAGARFGKTGGSATIPPPPPGIAPTAAQIAAMQGQQVAMTKKKNNFVHGGNGAGFTFW